MRGVASSVWRGGGRSEYDLDKALMRVAKCCTAVVACRVSPSQKASIVSLVRKNVVPEPMTLAIGACLWPGVPVAGVSPCVCCVCVVCVLCVCVCLQQGADAVVTRWHLAGGFLVLHLLWPGLCASLIRVRSGWCACASCRGRCQRREHDPDCPHRCGHQRAGGRAGG